MTGERLAAAAEETVGAPFRLHGRDPRTGLDCVGVLQVALAGIGRKAELPRAYSLRSRRIEGLEAIAENCGLRPEHGPIRPGDVLFLRTAACQFHLAIAARCGNFVHAHAGLRRVVLGPLPQSWPVAVHWRLRKPN